MDNEQLLRIMKAYIAHHNPEQNEDSTNLDYGVKGMKWGKRKGNTSELASAISAEEPHGGDKTYAWFENMRTSNELDSVKAELNDSMVPKRRKYAQKLLSEGLETMQNYTKTHSADETKQALVRMFDMYSKYGMEKMSEHMEDENPRRFNEYLNLHQASKVISGLLDKHWKGEAK